MFSFVGDTVLDPFAGTGTTAAAAVRAGRNAIAIECDPKYSRRAKNRLQQSAALMPL
jgi:site-specific DNA-methyltransferase (adenine-specific)